MYMYMQKIFFTQIFMYFSKPLRLLYSLILLYSCEFSFFALYFWLLAYAFSPSAQSMYFTFFSSRSSPLASTTCVVKHNNNNNNNNNNTLCYFILSFYIWPQTCRLQTPTDTMPWSSLRSASISSHHYPSSPLYLARLQLVKVWCHVFL